MLSEDEFRKLWLELGNPASWHWKTEHGFFVKKAQFVEAKHVTEVLEDLDSEHSSEAQEQACAIRTYLADVQKLFSAHGHAEAADAIGVLLSKQSKEGFSVPNPGIEMYSVRSTETMFFPACVEFAQSAGGVLQSAREAVTYRMHAGKEDCKYTYLTRTVCIYFKQGDSYAVAFDDDPFENILLTNTQEGYKAGRLWYVPLNHPFVANAIKRHSTQDVSYRS